MKTQPFRNLYNIYDTDLLTDIILQDYQKLRHVDYIKFSPMFSKKITGDAQYPICEWYNWVSPGKNRWNIMKLATKRSDKKFGGHSAIFCERQSLRGRETFMVTDCRYTDNAMVYFFPSHFFKRYNERMNLNLSGEELRRHYFSHNLSFEFKHEINQEEGTVKIQGFTADGVALGYLAKNDFYIFLTFVSHDMLHEGQFDIGKEELALSVEQFGRINNQHIKEHFNL